MSGIPSREYNQYLTAIEVANDLADKDALRMIQKQLISNYGASNDDVQYLIKRFRYYV